MAECLFPFRCGIIGSSGLFADKFFFYFNVTGFFEGGNMTGQIAIGKVEQGFNGIKIYSLVHHEYTHNAQADPVVKFFI